MKHKKLFLTMILFLLLGLSIRVLSGSRAEPTENVEENISEGAISSQNHFNEITPEPNKKESDELISQKTEEEQKTSFPIRIPTESQDSSSSNLDESYSLESEILKIIESLETMLEKASSTLDIERSRDFYQENKTILTQIPELKEDVRKRVEESLNDKILPILEDTQAPIISGITENDIVNQTSNIHITDETKIKIYLNQKETTLEQIKNLSQDGRYEILVVDEAFHESSLSFTLDTTLPVVTNVKIEKKDSSSHYAKHSDVIVVRMDANEKLQTNPYVSLGEKVYETKSVDNTNQYEVEIPLEKTLSLVSNEKITITISNVVDLAGNNQKEFTTTGENDTYVIYDDIVATVTKLEVFSSNVNPYFAKLNDEITLSFTVSEPLQEIPKIQIFGKEYLADEKALEQGTTSYQVHFIVNESMPEGPVLFSISNIVDRAGNVLEQTLSHETISKNVVIDYTPLEENWLFVLNQDSTNHKRVRDGEKLYIELVFEEAPTTTPILQVASFSPQEMKCVWRDESDGWASTKYKCDATVKIEENSGLISGEVVPIKITNIFDDAGNETVLTTESITEEKNKGYGQVIYDTVSPRFDLSDIPTTFIIGKDTYIYPQPGKVIDDVDTISFGNVHMQWFKQNVDGTKGEETKCFGWENWNTTLTNCEAGTYIVTYTVSDNAGNKTYEERPITLIEQDQTDYLTFKERWKEN
ncbi:TPA: hypothetical protein IAB29_00250 [Candidatus Ventrenecus stercoripullorum]|nr:hypothetical protein [Candidatus Ventrenecus stercoripullorum]